MSLPMMTFSLSPSSGSCLPLIAASRGSLALRHCRHCNLLRDRFGDVGGKRTERLGSDVPHAAEREGALERDFIAREVADEHKIVGSERHVVADDPAALCLDPLIASLAQFR
jgi:hypothetical protein